MIEIISHRGICDSNESSLMGIQNCINSGFGVELDLRIYNNFLYVSHNFSEDGTSFNQVCEILKKSSITKAFHIKEHNALNDIIQTLKKFNLINFFIFSTEKTELIIPPEITAASYINKLPNKINSQILWCDETVEKWFSKKIITDLQNSGKLIFAHSLELIQDCNMSEIKEEWSRLIELDVNAICTNFPKECKSYLGMISK